MVAPIGPKDYAQPRLLWNGTIQVDSLRDLNTALTDYRGAPATETRNAIKKRDLFIPHVAYVPRTQALSPAVRTDILRQLLTFVTEDKSNNPQLGGLLETMRPHVQDGLMDGLFWQVAEWLTPGFTTQQFEAGHPMAEIALITGRDLAYPPPKETHQALAFLRINWFMIQNKDRWLKSPFQAMYDVAAAAMWASKSQAWMVIRPNESSYIDAVIRAAGIQAKYYQIALIPDAMLFSNGLMPDVTTVNDGNLIFQKVSVLNPVPPSLVLARMKKTVPSSPYEDQIVKQHAGGWPGLRAQLFRGHPVMTRSVSQPVAMIGK